MDYKKQYKEALDRAKDWAEGKALPADATTENILNYIFPELTKSEDEKIIRCISDVIRKYGAEFATGTITKEKMISWLEKQGEHKRDTNYPKFDFNDVLALECCMETAEKVQEDEALYEKLKDLHSRVCDAYHFEKVKLPKEEFEQKEQKPAEWSEEDKDKLNHILEIIHVASGREVSVDEKEELESFLKSLHPQPKQEWSEEDERIKKKLISYFNGFEESTSFSSREVIEIRHWLKSLPERPNLQPKQEWSKEYERIRKDIERFLKQHNGWNKERIWNDLLQRL